VSTPVFAEDDRLGRFPPVEMTDLHRWLLSSEEYGAEMRNLTQGSFPERWFAAERRLRSDREALRVLADVGGLDLALQLLEEALPHLPLELADTVRQFMEK